MCLGYFVLLCRELEKLDIRHYYPAAAIQATLANIHRDRAKVPDAFDPWHFMPGWKIEREQHICTAAELAAFMGAIKREEDV